MKNTYFIGLFALLFLTAFASANLKMDLISVPTNVAHNAGSFSVLFNLTNTNPQNSTSFNLSASPTMTFSPAVNSLGANESKIINATMTFPASQFGPISGTITAQGSENTESKSFTVQMPFCKNGTIGGALSIDSVDIRSSGEDDFEWKPLDRITVEVRVENDGSDDVKEVNVELALMDSSGKNKVNDLTFISEDDEKVNLGTIKDGDDDTTTFEFTVPADFNTGDYKLLLKAFSAKDGEANRCTDSSSDLDSNTYQEISVDEETDEGKFIAFDNVVISPTQATCGDRVTLNLDAVNIGDTDEDQVRVNLYNKDLGIDTYYEIKQGLDQGDKEGITFTFSVPQNLQNKLYTLELSSEYDYSSGRYKQHSDDNYEVTLNVFGCSSASSSNKIGISASLESEAKAGEQLKIVARLTNNNQNATTIVVNAKDYDSWAELSSISERTLTLNAGSSKEVTLLFDVSKSASGEQSFTIETTDGSSVSSRDVAVNIAESKGFNLSNLFGGNSMIWVIGIINVVLIVLIILVAIRIARR